MFTTRHSLLALTALSPRWSSPGLVVEADDDGIARLVEYDGTMLPDEAIWTRHGQPKVEIVFVNSRGSTGPTALC